MKIKIFATVVVILAPLTMYTMENYATNYSANSKSGQQSFLHNRQHPQQQDQHWIIEVRENEPGDGSASNHGKSRMEAYMRKHPRCIAMAILATEVAAGASLMWLLLHGYANTTNP